MPPGNKSFTLSLTFTNHHNMLRTIIIGLFCFFSYSVMAQLSKNAVTVNDSSMAKVNVNVTDTKGNPSKGEEVLFRSTHNAKIVSGHSGADGKFSLHLPAGDTYTIILKSLGDTTKFGSINIPALEPGQFFTDPFKVNIKFEPARTYTLNDVHFDVGKATLRPESFKALEDLLGYMQNKNGVRIEIGGHTDNVGKDADNLKLSQQRAETIRNYLIRKGITASRVEAKGYGATEPVAGNETEEGRQLNRRTEIKIL